MDSNVSVRRVGREQQNSDIHIIHFEYIILGPTSHGEHRVFVTSEHRRRPALLRLQL
jgi:hypothetical protein